MIVGIVIVSNAGFLDRSASIFSESIVWVLYSNQTYKIK